MEINTLEKWALLAAKGAQLNTFITANQASVEAIDGVAGHIKRMNEVLASLQADAAAAVAAQADDKAAA